MKIKKNNGISLVVLIITIIVIIILTGVVILTLTNDNSISKSIKVAFMNDVESLLDELNIYNSDQKIFEEREYSSSKLQADETSITYDGVVDNDKTINDVLPSLKTMIKYNGQFEVVDGKLLFKGSDVDKKQWAGEMGIDVIAQAEVQVAISAISQTVVKQGVDVIYTVEFSSDVNITTINLAGKIEILDNNGTALPSQPTCTSGSISSVSPTRNIDVTIPTIGLSEGTYKLKIKAGAATDANDLTNITDKIASTSFTIDNTVPTDPTMVASPIGWTNGNVTVAITYSPDTITKQYSTNGTDWNSYTSSVVVSTNNTTVYAKGLDAAGNQSGQSTTTVASIDKIVPIITATDGGKTSSSVTVNASASDLGGSGLNTSSYQYSKDNGSTWTSATSSTNYTFNTLTPGTYQCMVKVLDNATNMATSSAVAISTDIAGIITMASNPSSGWTNGYVTVTITYPVGALTKQYSTDGAVWNLYTVPVVVSTNNTTVYAKGLDSGSNPLTQETLIVSNIDKIAPTVTASNGGTTSSSVTVNATASDTGGSGLNISSYQYSKDNGSTWTSATSATNYTFDTLTTGIYQCKVKVIDNATNMTTSSAVAINTTAVGVITQAANPTAWTNGNVTVTNTYPAETVTKLYSTNGTVWNPYTVPVVVSTNNTTVYAKGLDAGGNQIAQITLTVANIDLIVPIVTATDGGKTTSSVTVNASASDLGGSGLNTASYQYSNDNGSTWTATTSATNYTFNTLTTGTYQCKVKVSDNATNVAISSAVAISTTAVGTITQAANPTAWTNGNVTVTNTYPAETVTKQYSTNGTTWNTYTVPVVVSTNNTTVYAKGLDAGGNQIAQITLTVANIDTILPTVVYGTNGGSGSSASTTVTASDTGGSLLNTTTLQYKWDTQNITAPVSGWTTFTNAATITNGAAGTYYLWVKATDNAGNTFTTKSNLFTIIQLANAPVLIAGMTAKNWNGTAWVTVADPVNDTTWYDYANKKWANAQTADGSMWVWIPRYEYKITTTHSSTAQTIAVNFLINTPTTPTSGYIVHPAFTFGSTELTGIWVAKFEASGSIAAIDVKPQVVSVRNISINDIFTACRNMETNSRYGWGTTGTGIDTHLIKNVEWAAAAYLSQSIYGKNSEVWINPNNAYLTGQAGTSVSAASTATTYSYENLTYGVNASTTGNIYGIYDMSGGVYEYTAAYMNNANAILTTNGLSLLNAAVQYKDLYATTGAQQSKGYSANSTKVGDAMYETSTSYTGTTSWFTDYSELPYLTSPFFVRGGYFSGTTSAGIFSFYLFDGSNASATVGFRPTLAVNAAL